MNAPRRLTRDDVERAARALAPYLQPTPLRPCHAVDDAHVRIKLECWQPTGSFKVRGALNALLALPEDARRRGVLAASAGNHALGLAWAAAALGATFPVTLCVPESAPRAKLDKLRRYPVQVLVRGRNYDETYPEALAEAARTGAEFVHAFDDPTTAAGQGTLGLEILEALPDVATVVAPLGGGGLISALATALKTSRPDVRVIAVQAEASPAWSASLRAGRPLLTYPAQPTLADGVAGGIGELVFLHRDLIDDVVHVSEAEIEDALAALLIHDQLVVEASGVLGVAALRSGKLVRTEGPLVAVATGANVDATVLARVLRARV